MASQYGRRYCAVLTGGSFCFVCQDEGEVEIVWSDLRIPKNGRPSHTIATATTGQCIGDEGLLNTGYTEMPTHLFGANAKTPAFTYFIRRDELVPLLSHYPSVQEACRKAAVLKLERWQRETERIVRESSDGGDQGSRRLAAHTYQPRGDLPLPDFSSAIIRYSFDAANVQHEEEVALDDGGGAADNGSDASQAAGREPSNRELAAKIDALDAKLNKMASMMRRRV